MQIYQIIKQKVNNWVNKLGHVLATVHISSVNTYKQQLQLQFYNYSYNSHLTYANVQDKIVQ